MGVPGPKSLCQVDRERILDLVKQMPLELSCHKFASNVVEKGLLLGDARERSVIIRAIIGDPKEPQRLQMMVRDRFANYVVRLLTASRYSSGWMQSFNNILVKS